MPVTDTPFNDDLGTTEHHFENTAFIPEEPANGLAGLSQEELNDPNSISVTVADAKAPLVVLFGPPACGKTMTLVRLTRFLQQQGYIVSPIRTFRPAFDTNYATLCDKFNEMMNSNDAATSTNRVSFMLVEVIKNGRRLCQILEAPGEYYFNPERPNEPFPNYVNTIISSQNRKVWAVMVEPDWLNHSDRMNYVNRISRLKQNMRSRDEVVFIFNKIDKTNFAMGIGKVNISAAINDIRNLYPGIFNAFKNQNPITSLWRKYNCEFVPFQTGYYTKALNKTTFQEGPREYCLNFWNTIMKKITG